MPPRVLNSPTSRESRRLGASRLGESASVSFGFRNFPSASVGFRRVPSLSVAFPRFPSGRTFCICHGSMCICHGSSTWCMHRERRDKEAKANTQGTHDLQNYRGRPSAAPQRGRAAFGRPPPLCNYSYVGRVCLVCSLWPPCHVFPCACTMWKSHDGCTWSHGRCKSSSSPVTLGFSHVSDLVCAPLLVHVEDVVCEPLLVHVEDLACEPLLSCVSEPLDVIFCSRICLCCSQGSVLPLWVHVTNRWPPTPLLDRVLRNQSSSVFNSRDVVFLNFTSLSVIIFRYPQISVGFSREPPWIPPTRIPTTLFIPDTGFLRLRNSDSALPCGERGLGLDD